jgi:hypothetical protein
MIEVFAMYFEKRALVGEVTEITVYTIILYNAYKMNNTLVLNLK